MLFFLFSVGFGAEGVVGFRGLITYNELLRIIAGVWVFRSTSFGFETRDSFSNCSTDPVFEGLGLVVGAIG